MSSLPDASTPEPDVVNLVVEERKPEPRVKQAPTRKGLGTPFVYHHSADGTDENLLILLHGLGARAAFFS